MSNPIEKMSNEITRKEAIELGESGWWKNMPAKDVALAQLQQDRLCMDFGDFHAAVEKALGYSVFSSEFGSQQRVNAIIQEIKGISLNVDHER